MRRVVTESSQNPTQAPVCDYLPNMDNFCRKWLSLLLTLEELRRREMRKNKEKAKEGKKKGFRSPPKYKSGKLLRKDVLGFLLLE